MDRAQQIVDGIPLSRRIVLLGESTHGTEEFYRTRAAVTRRLVEERGFTAICFEADWPFMQAANAYTHGRRPTPFPLDGEGGRFPKWMWHNQCMAEFFDWCKDRTEDATPDLFGIDCYSLFESKRAVLAFLETHDPEFAAEAKDRLAFLDKYKTPHEYAEAMVHGGLSRVSGHLQDVLTKIQSRLQWGSKNYKCSDVERLSVEQNCEVIIGADEYYRKCVSEPAGSQASWNARDQHMTTTLLRIQAHLKDPKIVIWAHNSHVGDSTATKRGGVSFAKNETWNLGQMARATFGRDKVWIVGQYTHAGEVMAAQHWGGPHKARTLNPSLPASYECAMHKVQGLLGHTDPFFFNTKTFAAPVEGGAVDQAAKGGNPVAEAMVGMMNSKESRLQRWVGVSYKADTERRSHYGELVLHRCYDQIVFVDTSRALAPVAPKKISQAAAVGIAAAAGGDNAGESPSGASHPSSSSSRTVNRRLLKEYRRLMRSPPPGIEAHPLETNILEWHFVLRMTQSPFTGGEYHGTLTFPPEYPMRPPRFKVFTPSGRFAPGQRLCLSMSDYHPESWNPSWSVETLLVGLQSFMYEDSNAIGSIRTSARERERLAKLSRRFNRKDNDLFVEMFCADGDSGSGSNRSSGGADPDDDDSKTQESVCRYCLRSDGALMSPCMCKGSNEWVHLECLRTWQKQVLLTQPTHPKYHTDIDRICNVCLEPFTGAGIPKSRHEQIMSYTGGQIAAMVRPGNLLVSSRSGSRENLELISKHPEIKRRLMTWTKAVFLMLSTGPINGGGLLAVSTSMPVDGVPADVKIGTMERMRWATRTAASARSGSSVRLRHFDGGPMNRKVPICVAHVHGAKEWATKIGGCRALPPDWIFGAFESVSAAVAAAKAKAKESTAGKKAAAAVAPATINVVWGCGGWGGTQVLAEIARGGWGLIKVEDYLSLRPDPTMEMDWLLDLEWSRVVSIASLAPQSEYSRKKR